MLMIVGIMNEVHTRFKRVAIRCCLAKEAKRMTEGGCATQSARWALVCLKLKRRCAKHSVKQSLSLGQRTASSVDW